MANAPNKNTLNGLHDCEAQRKRQLNKVANDCRGNLHDVKCHDVLVWNVFNLWASTTVGSATGATFAAVSPPACSPTIASLAFLVAQVATQ